MNTDPRNLRRDGSASLSARPLSFLFVVNDRTSADLCVKQLETKINSSVDVVFTLSECTAKLRAQPYDLVVAEYPNAHWSGSHDLKLLQQTARDIPLLFLLTSTGSESLEELTANGTFDYLEQRHLAQMAMVVRRLLNERKLRTELEDAGKALQHSQWLYRALVDNPTYGILSCAADGTFLEVNDALVVMLGYGSKNELVAVSRSSETLPGLALRLPLSGHAAQTTVIEPIEVAWQRKNGTMLRAELSGRAVQDDAGRSIRFEVIVIDVTAQRELENRLRREASCDPLTFLANRRTLLEALHAEICRSKRTGREFSLVLLDMDGLKAINDHLGHRVGDRALCRLARILVSCSRSVDTAARHGGDEFALILPETNKASAFALANRVCRLLQRDVEKPLLSVSFGIASFLRDADAMGDLMHAADIALYTMKAKRQKRDRI